MRPRGIVATLVVFVALLAAAPAAALASTADDAYCDGCGAVQHKQIPFTGLDIVLVVAAGGGLLAAGYGVRRLSRSDTA